MKLLSVERLPALAPGPLLVLEVMFVRRPLAVTILRPVTSLSDATRYLTSMGTLAVFGMKGVT